MKAFVVFPVGFLETVGAFFIAILAGMMIAEAVAQLNDLIWTSASRDFQPPTYYVLEWLAIRSTRGSAQCDRLILVRWPTKKGRQPEAA